MTALCDHSLNPLELAQLLQLSDEVPQVTVSHGVQQAERLALIRASTWAGLNCSRLNTGSSIASSVFLTSKPSSVSPSIDKRRLKNKVSGSSWRRANNKKS